LPPLVLLVDRARAKGEKIIVFVTVLR